MNGYGGTPWERRRLAFDEDGTPSLPRSRI